MSALQRLEAETAQRLTPAQHRILGRGWAFLYSLQNVALGTPGGELMDLCWRGLMQWGAHEMDRDASSYVITSEGLDAYRSYGPPYVPVTRV